MSEQEPKLVLPEWARWVTKNAAGELVVHQEKPFKNKYCGGWYPPAGTRLAYLVGKKWETSLRYVTWDQKEPTPIRQSKNVIVVGSATYPNFSAVVSDENKNKTLETVRTWMREAEDAAFTIKTPDDSPDDAPAATVDGPDDMINHPPHYNQLSFQPIDILEEVAIEYPQIIGFHIGTALKYLMRAPFKGKMIEDLKKARYYIDRAIAKVEGME